MGTTHRSQHHQIVVSLEVPHAHRWHADNQAQPDNEEAHAKKGKGLFDKSIHRRANICDCPKKCRWMSDKSWAAFFGFGYRK
jgi:hypothetical protein